MCVCVYTHIYIHIYTHIYIYNKCTVTVTMKVKKAYRLDQNYPFKERVLVMEISYLLEINDFLRAVFFFLLDVINSKNLATEYACLQKLYLIKKSLSILLIWRPVTKPKSLI